MQIKFVNPRYRSVGDCKLARGHHTKGLYFDCIKECQDLIIEVTNAFPNIMPKPTFTLKARRTRRKSAHVEYMTGRITFFPMGFRVSTLLHECAHLMPGGMGHQKAFKVNQTKLLQWYDATHKAEPTAPKIIEFAFGDKKIEESPKVFQKAADNHISTHKETRMKLQRGQKPLITEYKVDRYVTASGFHTTRWSLK